MPHQRLARWLAGSLLWLMIGGGSVAAAARVRSGISGRVLLGPTCPVQRPGQSCERPYQTTVAIFTASTHRPVRTFKSGRDGHFRVRLAPGAYTLQAARGGRPFTRPVAVTVRRRRFSTVTITFDTGIR